MMDRRTLIAVALCLMVLILYPFVLRMTGMDRLVRGPARTVVPDSARVQTGPAPADSPAAPRSPEQRPAAPTGEGASPGLGGSAAAPVPSPSAAEAVRTSVIETPLYRATFSNRGARLESVELKRYASAHTRSRRRGGESELPPEERVKLSGSPSLLLQLGSGTDARSLDQTTFAVSESLDAAGAIRALSFLLTDGSGMVLRKTYRVRPDDYALDLEVEIRNVPISWRLGDYSLTTRSWPLLEEADAVAESRFLKATSLVGTNLHREGMGGLKRGPKTFAGSAAWASVQSRYFIGAVAVEHGEARAAVAAYERRPLEQLPSGLTPQVATALQEIAVNSLVMALPPEHQPVHRFVVYFGPAEYFRLSRLGHQLEKGVDFGWSWIIPFSKVLLQLLNWIHSLVHNYGLAIIVLATLVRVVLHPLNAMSMRSMREMQKVQPEVERLRAKYKNDAQAMNTALMALYKDHKVNPAGGCLPMLLQMPLFFALYSVLFNSIELRQAPFVGWIDDLSAPDLLFQVGPVPVRLLPLLMTASGLLSQKLTPTDPRQVTTMYLMNVVMLVFFYNLPSGLVLYWTVMNLMTALQQWLVLREDAETTPRPAVAKKAAAK